MSLSPWSNRRQKFPAELIELLLIAHREQSTPENRARITEKLKRVEAKYSALARLPRRKQQAHELAVAEAEAFCAFAIHFHFFVLSSMKRKIELEAFMNSMAAAGTERWREAYFEAYTEAARRIDFDSEAQRLRKFLVSVNTRFM